MLPKRLIGVVLGAALLLTSLLLELQVALGCSRLPTLGLALGAVLALAAAVVLCRIGAVQL